MSQTAHKQQVVASEQAPLPQVHLLSLLSEELRSAVVFAMQLLHSGLSVGHSSSAVSSFDVGSASQWYSYLPWRAQHSSFLASWTRGRQIILETATTLSLHRSCRCTPWHQPQSYA